MLYNILTAEIRCKNAQVPYIDERDYGGSDVNNFFTTIALSSYEE